jgi:hypothetical protein
MIEFLNQLIALFTVDKGYDTSRHSAVSRNIKYDNFLLQTAKFFSKKLYRFICLSPKRINAA